jgi:hypothetical protein
MGRRSQNGPTFTKAPPKHPRRLTNEERAARLARQAAELEETKRLAAKSRRFHKLLHTDTRAALQELGLLPKKN